MEPNKKTSSKCGDVLHKGSSFLSFISLFLIVTLFLRMESINRKTEMNELRISKVETYVQTELLQTTDHRNDMEILEGHHQRKERNAPQKQNTPAISLQQVRQEIKEKLSQACTSKDKICQEGLPGPKGDPGPPGFKGESGAPGITGPQGPLGPIGAPGPSGKQGRQGPQGIKGDLGGGGPRGIPGVKGDIGAIGRPGEKGSVGLKGNKGNRGYTGLQGPKGECIVDLKISIYPVSQEVFINTTAIFYCWVDGQISKQITWSKLGGALLKDTTVKDGELHINNVQRSHVGLYMCTAYTGYGILKAISNLHLKEPPIFTKKPPSQVVVERGSTVSLCCEATGSPRPRIEWSRAHQLLSPPPTVQENGCLEVNTAEKYSDGVYICRSTNRFGLAEALTAVIAPLTGASCDQILEERSGSRRDGIYNLNPTGNAVFAVYCDMTRDGNGWSLIARFSNYDNKNWMRDDGSWWYDRQVAMGTTTNPVSNSDMISPAFWLVSGREFKITRSDDPSHTPLLQTTDNCLAGQTFRSKITSYGDFRNGKFWASGQCLGSCTVQYDRLYRSTDGFQQAECSGDIQSTLEIGFWCGWNGGDGSVMMIGGGGRSCAGADHGIGITETGAASFVDLGSNETEFDFGYDANTGSVPSQSYSLNLWIR